ncbi:MAG: DNRLRE domain-containing protein, partial [Aliivibrio sp.]|nr:DNRLRE domain-containing protein [Aliivibrio sp.]
VTWNSFVGSYAPEVEGTFNASTDWAWHSTDVSSLVGSWLDGTNSNYGLLLDQVNKTFPRTTYSVREKWENASYLEICYTDAGGSLVCDTTKVIQDTFIYELLLAYGHRKQSVTRLRLGERNLASKGNAPRHDQIIWKRHLYFKQIEGNALHTPLCQGSCRL